MSAKILIVDDEKSLLKLVGIALHKEGYQAMAAVDAKQALERIETENPDLVILDWMLPGMSGIDLLKRIRGDERTVALPVIILSAKGLVEDKVEGLLAGADDYVAKPVEMAELIARVRAILNRSERLAKTGPITRSETIGFIGVKGGAGTTTLLLNTAAQIADEGEKVIITEFGSRIGGYAAHLNHKPVRTIADLDDDLSRDNLRHCLYKYSPRLEILFGPGTNMAYSVANPDQNARIISALNGMADYVLVDLSSVLDTLSESVLRRIDRLILVMEREATSVRAAQEMIQMAELWGMGRGVINLVLVNRTSLATGLSQDEIAQTLGCQVVGMIPNAGEALMSSTRQGEILIRSNQQTPAANSYRQLANLIRNINQDTSVLYRG